MALTDRRAGRYRPARAQKGRARAAISDDATRLFMEHSPHGFGAARPCSLPLAPGAGGRGRVDSVEVSGNVVERLVDVEILVDRHADHGLSVPA